MATQSYRDMTSHRLQPMRHFYKGNHLVCNAVPWATQTALFSENAMPAGRCLHLDPTADPGTLPTAKLGCSGNNKVPVWLFRDSDAYSGGFPGPSSVTSTSITWDDGSTGQLLFFVGLEGYELATSEFDKTQTYKVGQYLKAPEHDPGHGGGSAVHAQTIAGIATNDSVLYGRDTIVGIVSPAVFQPLGKIVSGDIIDPDGTAMLPFYTTYRPPVAALTTALLGDIKAFVDA